MTYLHPLGYLLGVEGAALLHAFRDGSADRAFVDARLAEIRRLLDTPELAGADGVDAAREALDSNDLYRPWAATYDDGNNQMITVEEPAVRAVLDRLPAGDALDAACGTGRHTAHLAARGHRVIGVDRSPEMLERARARLPEADFRTGDLHHLPVDDASADLVLCTLALEHVPELGPVLAEFARVLRPGGHLVVSDAHVATGHLAPMIPRPGPDGRAALPVSRRRGAEEYVSTALAHGFAVRGCTEPRRPRARGPLAEPAAPAGPVPPHGSWELLEYCPAAAEAALGDTPIVVVWHFQREPAAS